MHADPSVAQGRRVSRVESFEIDMTGWVDINLSRKNGHLERVGAVLWQAE